MVYLTDASFKFLTFLNAKRVVSCGRFHEDVDFVQSPIDIIMMFLCDMSGVRVEGILRQSADVDEVEKRVRDYEQGTRCFFF